MKASNCMKCGVSDRLTKDLFLYRYKPSRTLVARRKVEPSGRDNLKFDLQEYGLPWLCGACVTGAGR